ncbi:MAG: acetate/propionate family kinase [Planctomycetota bacterium]
MTKQILVFNVGSTTLKFALIDADSLDPTRHGSLERIGSPGGDAASHLHAAREVLSRHVDDNVTAVGHRVVQGGSRFVKPTVVTESTLDELATLDPLAPLHNPPARAVITAIMSLRPDLPQVMVFDSAFFASLPAAAYRYAVSQRLVDELGVRRYGMHGTSHDYVTQQAVAFLRDRVSEPHLITLHLGGGASATASVDGVAVETSMGMTPLEGLVMATRCGDIDPAVVLHLMTQGGMTVDQVDAELNKRSGLLGMCGDADMRAILERVADDDLDAALALDVYVHRIVKYVGAYAAAMGRLDALVFTAGIGQHAPRVRQLIAERLGLFGVELDRDLNESTTAPTEVVSISAKNSALELLVIPTNEEQAIAIATRVALG